MSDLEQAANDALARLEEVCREIFPMKAENDLASLELVELSVNASSLRMRRASSHARSRQTY